MHWAIGRRAVPGEGGLCDSRGPEVETGKKWITMEMGRSAHALELRALNRQQKGRNRAQSERANHGTYSHRPPRNLLPMRR